MSYKLEIPEDYAKRLIKFLKKHKDITPKYVKVIRLLEADPFHPSLRLHKLSGKLNMLHSVSIDMQYRITIEFYMEDEKIIFVNIGTHDRNQRYKVSKDNKWTFYIVSSNIKPEVFTEFSGKNNDIIYDKDSNFIVYCKTWDELIRKSKLSLSKQQDELNIQIKEARKEDLLTQYLQDVSFQS